MGGAPLDGDENRPVETGDHFNKCSTLRNGQVLNRLQTVYHVYMLMCLSILPYINLFNQIPFHLICHKVLFHSVKAELPTIPLGFGTSIIFWVKIT